MDSLLSSDLFLPVLLLTVLLFAGVMKLIERAFPNLFANYDGEGSQSSAKSKASDIHAWTVDTHGRPTPHSDNRSINGGF